MPLRPYVFQEFPKRVWHPDTGRWKDAKGPGDIPDGWLDRHPMDPVHAHPSEEDIAAGVAAPGDKPPEGNLSGAPVPTFSKEDREQIINTLKSRGIPFNSRAPTAALLGVLEEAAKKEA